MPTVSFFGPFLDPLKIHACEIDVPDPSLIIFKVANPVMCGVVSKSFLVSGRLANLLRDVHA